MKLKFFIAILALLIPALAFAQGAAPRPTKADAEKVVAIIKGDPAKTATYCQIAALGDQMNAAQEKKDQKKFDELSKQMDALGQKLGPEYVKLMAGMDGLDPDKKADKALIDEIGGVLQQLDALCKK